MDTDEDYTTQARQFKSIGMYWFSETVLMAVGSKCRPVIFVLLFQGGSADHTGDIRNVICLNIWFIL